MKLDFVCIGAQKAGTTTLHDILNTHPDIYLPPDKEAHFFDVEDLYVKGLKYYFNTFFPTYNNERYLGNINPNLHNDVKYLERIKDNFGTEIKIVFILRNPVKRAYSHFLMSKRRDFEKLNFLDALKEEPNRLKSSIVHRSESESGYFEKRHFSYVSRGQYSHIVKFLFEEFGEEKVKIVLFEDFVHNIPKSINQILDFLNIQVSSEMDYEAHSNQASLPKNEFINKIIRKQSLVKRVIAPILGKELKSKLLKFIISNNQRKLNPKEIQLDGKDAEYVYKHYFEKDIEKLELLLGINLDGWKYKN